MYLYIRSLRQSLNSLLLRAKWHIVLVAGLAIGSVLVVACQRRGYESTVGREVDDDQRTA